MRHWMGMYMDGDFIVHLAGHKLSRKMCFVRHLHNLTETTAVWSGSHFHPVDWACYDPNKPHPFY
jgi:hypothetical protein